MLRTMHKKCSARDCGYNGMSFDHIWLSLTVFVVFTPIYAFGHFADFRFGCFLKVCDAVSCWLGVFRGGEHDSEVYFKLRIALATGFPKKSRIFSFFSHFLRFLPIFLKNRLWNLWICCWCFEQLWLRYKSVPRTRRNTHCGSSYDHLNFGFFDFFASFWSFSRILEIKPSGSRPTGLSLKYVTRRGFSPILNTIGLISRSLNPKNWVDPRKSWFWPMLRCQLKYHFWKFFLGYVLFLCITMPTIF